MKKIKVNVVIAGRTYPLSVNSTQEEEGLRKAAKDINQLISNYEQNYAVNDKQDVLAMCALQFASRAEIATIRIATENDKALKKIDELNNLLAQYLE